MQPSIDSTEISIAELEVVLEQARQEPLREDGYEKLRNAVRTLGLVTELVERQETTLAELRELLCPASTEKTARVLQRAGINSGEKKPAERKKPPVGHGRNAAAAYRGARRIQVPHESLKSGDPCPAGCGGKIYRQQDPALRVVANCLAHGRRAFVKVIASFPEQCRFVLETLSEVYQYDEQARAARLTPEERLHFHQQHSQPVMDKLEVWLKAQFAERLAEPNYGLGKAIS